MRNNYNYWDTLHSYYRNELGVRMVCHVLRGGYTQIHACGPYSDAPSTFDHSAFFSGADEKQELRNALRRHARRVKGVAA